MLRLDQLLANLGYCSRGESRDWTDTRIARGETADDPSQRAFYAEVRSEKKSCIHIVHTDDRIIPFDTFNLFFSAGKEARLRELQAMQAAKPKPNSHGTRRPRL